jgi:predicted tellurium resistance membrane protein TerC
MEWITDPAGWVALLTLIALEIVLGIDNIIFISILVARLPEERRDLARRLGLGLALGTRLLLLLSLAWIMGLKAPFFHMFGQGISGRDLILIFGGLFLLWKSVHEIHNSLEGEDHPADAGAGPSAVGRATFGGVLIQIALIDIVFSLDSVITAVGLVDHVSIMVIAIIVSVIVMLFAAKPIGEFVERHPTIKMLALAFLTIIGIVLLAEGFEVKIPKGAVYFAMAFSLGVELLNIRMRGSRAKPVKLHRNEP